MRLKTFISPIIPQLFLFMLGGCLGPDYLVTSIEPVSFTETAGLHDPEPRYTSHHSTAAKPEIVRIAVDEQFTLYERAKILRAINEWNLVLNGFVRFDISPMTNGSRSAADHLQSWFIVPERGGRPPPVNGTTLGHALAATLSAPQVGGMVVVYVDRVRGYDLANVMRHELGHVLGLGHDRNGRLMSSRYVTNRQQCIDQAATDAIAANRKLPAAQLNWCGPTNLASATDGSSTRLDNRATR
jgi:Matrixin